MRRLTILLAAVLLLAGCGRAGERGVNSPRTTDFQCKVNGSLQETAILGTMERGNAGELTLVLEQPASLAGITMTMAAGTLTLTVEGISVPLERSTLPASGLMQTLCTALDEAAGQPIAADGSITMAETAILWINIDTGTITQISTTGLELKFSEVIFT